MKFISSLHTDVGIRKKTNQDSMLLQHAMTDYGEIVFAVVCDGMGGLQKGEVASASLIEAFSKWFKESLPGLIANGTVDTAKLRDQWDDILDRLDSDITRYGNQNGIRLGTTMTCALIFGNTYYVANVGDSRVYLLSDNMYQITHDHTVVQQKIDRGIITLEESFVDPERSILLQCIGAGDILEPDFFTGNIAPNNTVLLCCDGFRHKMQPAEFYQYLNAGNLPDEKSIEAVLTAITEALKSRGETDNISAILIRTA